MSKYIVSARKYRPAHFSEVVGQEHVSQTLKNALQTDHLAHAFLFCGPRGVGKTTCARILAKVINCENLNADFEACNTCSSCKAFNENASFNITELDAASNNSVEHIRALIEQVRFQPQQGKYKVFIIDEVHMLSQQAFNAFLKTLEEPPPYAVFILATTEKHKIIPTILSRCQVFDFRRIQVPDMVAHLQRICEEEGIEADGDALHIIAQKADGALRDALSIFDRIVSFSGKHIRYEDVIQNLNILDYDYFFRLTEALLSEDGSRVFLLLDEILRNGFDPDLIINGLGEHLRNLLVCKDEQTLALLEVSTTLKNRYREQAALAPKSFLLTALNLANECDINYKMARNKRLHAEMGLIKMAYINREINRAQVAVTEKKKPESAPSGKEAGVTVPPMQQPPPPKKKVIIPPVSKTSATPIKKNSKYNLPKLTSIDSLEESVESDAVSQLKKSGQLNQDTLLEVWQKFADNVPSPSLKNILKNAEVSLETGKENVIARVGTQMAKEMILQEQNFMHFLRDALHAPNLAMDVIVDVEKAQKIIPKPKKTLSTKEKYTNLCAMNPLLDQLRIRFDLKFNNEI